MRARRFLQVVPRLKDEAGAIVGARCDRGAQIVLRLAFPPEAAEAVRSLDEHWNGKGQPDGLAGEEIPELARIAALAQAAEVFFVRDGLAGGPHDGRAPQWHVVRAAASPTPSSRSATTTRCGRSFAPTRSICDGVGAGRRRRCSTPTTRASTRSRSRSPT